MSDYRLVVTREEENPTFATEQVEWEKRRDYATYPSSLGGGPSRTIQRQVIDVTLTEAEYLAVKRAAIEASK